jgi:excisionase family DNA binding protein
MPTAQDPTRCAAGAERGIPLPGQYRKPRDVADQLNVTLQTVYAWIRSGELPSVLLSPRARRIAQEDLDRFLAARRQGGEAA